jgi:hypothetical protein
MRPDSVLLKSRSHRTGFSYHAFSKIGISPYERKVYMPNAFGKAGGARYGRHWGLVMMQPVLYPMQ